MSLRRRIAIAAAVAVAAVAVGIGIAGYASARSHLVGELKGELRNRAQAYLQPHRQGRGPSDQGRPRGGQLQQGGPGFHAPGGPAFGGAAGYFQVVLPNGKIVSGGSYKLPVDSRVLKLARRASGSFFSSARISGYHVEILTSGDPYDHWAVQVALPLTGVDSVLHGLLVDYGIVAGAGVLIALVLGAAISRSALAPIERFLRRTEDVTSTLEHPGRLEETGASELRRLATSFNQTLDALERSIEAQRNLVADASHELRTPIASLRSDIQIFLDADKLPVQERRELQRSIVAELDELTQVVADVVELARGSAPGAYREQIELDAVVREVVQRTRRRAPELQFRLDLEPTVIGGAPDSIGRAVTNLIDNARKWGPADSEIEVSLREGTLSVRDHGPGFDERDLPHVFDRFYRAVRARRLPGSGLGLAIVKQAAQAHGGYAQARNAPGGGAVVTVSFGPLEASTAASRTPAEASTADDREMKTAAERETQPPAERETKTTR